MDPFGRLTIKFTRTITITKIERSVQILRLGTVAPSAGQACDPPSGEAPQAAVATDPVAASEPEDESGKDRK